MKTMIITGGARGIGAHMVRCFANQGYRVAFCYRANEEAALQLSKETGALAVRCDVRDEAQVKAFVAEGVKTFKHIDAVVINAGVAWAGLTEEMSAVDFDRVCDTNLRGAFLCMREALPYLRDTKGAAVLISSMWGVVGASCETAYAATKAAVQSMARSLAKEVGPSGVRINCIAPGAVDTDMMKDYSEEDKRALAEETPLGRLATCEDIAQAAGFLLSDNASFITGQTLVVDGGFTL